jgi:hypothetical protein
VRDYPLSAHADDAAAKLKELELPVPEADKTAVARMQYEKDHKEKLGFVASKMLPFRRNPDTSAAAHQGDPAMTTMRPSVPPLVPQPAGAAGALNGDVTATTVGNSTALDTKPDARANPPAQGDAAAAGQPAAATTATPAAASTDPAQQAAQQPAADANAKKKKKGKKQPAAAPTTDQPASAQPATATPAAAQPGATPPSPPSN